jgi:hypothetical protein
MSWMCSAWVHNTRNFFRSQKLICNDHFKKMTNFSYICWGRIFAYEKWPWMSPPYPSTSLRRSGGSPNSGLIRASQAPGNWESMRSGPWLQLTLHMTSRVNTTLATTIHSLSLKDSSELSRVNHNLPPQTLPMLNRSPPPIPPP